MTRQTSFLKTLCQTLQQSEIPFALVGGHAVALHGAVRGTVDIDLIILWQKKHLMKLEQTLTSMGLISRLPLTAEDIFNFRDEYIEKRHLIAWNFYNPADLSQQVDVLINYDLGNKPIKQLAMTGVKVPLLNINDLITMKKTVGRPQDIADIAALEKLR